jgi:hypothetical protein
MKNVNDFDTEIDVVAEKASQEDKNGNWLAWLMMFVGVIATGTMTYSLTHKGMTSSVLWKGWVSLASFGPVLLLEGSAVALTYGKHHWFKSTEQRTLADFSSWVIWVVLALTSVAHFALGKSQDGLIQSVMGFYASYILPLAIVGVPMLWKWLYDLAPESQIQVAIMELEAEVKSELIEIRKEDYRVGLEAYRAARDTDRVKEARGEIFELASIKRAENIAGFIQKAPIPELLPADEEEGEESEALIAIPVDPDEPRSHP